MGKLKAGELRVEIEQEEQLWFDRKRKTVFALPWSFTKYSLTKSRLFVQKGFLNREENEIKLYRVNDITFTQSFWERLGGTGTLCIKSSDATMPELHLQHIKNAKVVKDVISKYVEQSRMENGVRTSEIVNGGVHHPGGHDSDVDLNHDGIPDALEEGGTPDIPVEHHI